MFFFTLYVGWIFVHRHLRLELLEGVVAFHSGQLEKSRQALASAKAKFVQVGWSIDAYCVKVGEKITSTHVPVFRYHCLITTIVGSSHISLRSEESQHLLILMVLLLIGHFSAFRFFCNWYSQLCYLRPIYSPSASFSLSKKKKRNIESS